MGVSFSPQKQGNEATVSAEEMDTFFTWLLSGFGHAAVTLGEAIKPLRWCKICHLRRFITNCAFYGRYTMTEPKNSLCGLPSRFRRATDALSSLTNPNGFWVPGPVQPSDHMPPVSSGHN